MYAPLSVQACEEALDQLSGWRLEDHALQKTFHFSDFRAAVAAIVRISFEAEALNHHPELFNVWNRVEFKLRTHDAGNLVTAQDVALAKRIEAVLSESV
ncbi:MAG: 4a-hydroxytetrahydrobiopterin dehydratase [Rhodothermia bacterium]|mgnify:FL=1|nr:4a-hydroxytetrahydrobiopterin dehydratase [Rhodothermia bacterium]